MQKLLQELVEVVDEANAFGQSNNWPIFKEYPQYDRLRELGQQIYKEAGFEGMQEACNALPQLCRPVRGLYGTGLRKPAEHVWEGIGGWLP